MNPQQLEKQLQQQGHLLDDPLALHEQLVSHYSSSSSSNSSENSKLLLNALERCTQMLVDDKRYVNDLRYFRIWMQYAKLCTDPVGIFDFLYQRRLFRDLASFYEEWARLSIPNLDICRQIISKGIQNGAQPVGRLKQTMANYNESASSDSLLMKRDSWENGTSVAFFNQGQSNITTKRPLEVPFYDPAIIDSGRISFEQARAKYYRLKCQQNSHHHQQHQHVAKGLETLGKRVEGIRDEKEEEEDDEDVPGLSQPINPDELTHISVYKDNTTGDLSRLLRETNNNNNNSEAVLKICKDLITSIDIPHDNVLILPKLAIVTNSNTTAPAVKTLIGHFYLESKLTPQDYLAVDVSSDQDMPQKIVLHVDSQPWPIGGYEAAFILKNIPSVSIRVCYYQDAVLYSYPQYPGGSMAHLFKRRQSLHPILGLFLVRDFLQQLVKWHTNDHYFHGGLCLDRSFIHFTLPRCTLILLGARPWDTIERGQQADWTALESISAALYKYCGKESIEWKSYVQALQRKTPLIDLLTMLEEWIQSYRGPPSLKSLLNRLELDILSS